VHGVRQKLMDSPSSARAEPLRWSSGSYSRTVSGVDVIQMEPTVSFFSGQWLWILQNTLYTVYVSHETSSQVVLIFFGTISGQVRHFSAISHQVVHLSIFCTVCAIGWDRNRSWNENISPDFSGIQCESDTPYFKWSIVTSLRGTEIRCEWWSDRRSEFHIQQGGWRPPPF
jgi:hypothetical protein